MFILGGLWTLAVLAFGLYIGAAYGATYPEETRDFLES